MIRYMQLKDKETFLAMTDEFYHTTAVDHTISAECYLKTFDECTSNSPYARGYMLEYEGQNVGYGLISLTYSAEVGGLSVLMEELYIRADYRSKGLGKEFFNFIYSEFPEAKRFRLEVTAANERAAKLYSTLGFERLDYIQMIRDIKE